MTDSKTAKKIEVNTCKLHAPNFEVTINGRYHWCGTEAEAQAKAKQLRLDAAIDETITEHAAAQPTETRPPQKVYTMFRNKRFGTWSIAFNGQALISGLSKEDAENTLKRYNEAARAAAPVEPPKYQSKNQCEFTVGDENETHYCVLSLNHEGDHELHWTNARVTKCGKYLGDWRNLNVRCQLPKHHEGNCSSEPPATELVEPAPRPQGVLTCICGVSFGDDNVKMLAFHEECPRQRFIHDKCPDCGNSQPTHYCPKRNPASPVARPQMFEDEAEHFQDDSPDDKREQMTEEILGKQGYQHNSDDENLHQCDACQAGAAIIEVLRERGIFDEPAARVEQPTPRLPDFEVAEKLYQMANTSAELEKKSNTEIGRLMYEHVINHLDMTSPFSNLLEEAADRLIQPDCPHANVKSFGYGDDEIEQCQDCSKIWSDKNPRAPAAPVVEQRELPRIETGVVQFDGDWPGVFIRGDNAFGMAMHLKMLFHKIQLANLKPELNSLEGVIRLLESCNVSNKPNSQLVIRAASQRTEGQDA